MLFKRTRFETEMQVRQDEIDMFRHVHSSKYLDYLLHARFDQMERCYGMAMEEFLKLGLGWVVKTSHIEWNLIRGINGRSYHSPSRLVWGRAAILCKKLFCQWP